MLDATHTDPCTDALHKVRDVHLYSYDGEEEYFGDAYFEVDFHREDDGSFWTAELHGIRLTDNSYVDGSELAQRCDSRSINELEDMVALELGQ